MKKILNNPEEFVADMLDGLYKAHPDQVTYVDDIHSLVRADAPVEGKVGLMTGGGSGHLPVFLGYVGDGLIDACAVGNVFAGPRVDDCQAAAHAADGGAGVLQLYGNYGGDRMNFDMAQEFLEMEGIRVASVRVADDVASAPPQERAKRRGVAGMVYAYKIAGARAAEGGSLDDVAAAATRAADACRSIGVALTPCVVPESGKASFSIADDQIEFGMGIHGEPGIWRGPLKTADALVDEMLERLLGELDIGRGSRVAVLVNSLGATPHEELYIMYRRVAQVLDARGAVPVMPLG